MFHLCDTSILDNGASTPSGFIPIATEQQREEPGLEFLVPDPVTVYGQRVSVEVIAPTGIYHYCIPTKICTPCNASFIDHKSWKDHLKKHHSHIMPKYQCSKCSRQFPSIFGVSSHYPKCILPTTNQSRDLEFKCPNCEASFSSKRGLGVHRWRKHPTEHEAYQNVQRTKERWSQEELSFRAECEASIPTHITNRNQLLQPYFPHRTIESIKGVRKGERYLQLLQTAKEKLNQEPLSDEPPVKNNSPSEQQPEVNLDANNLSTTNQTTNSTSNQDNSTSTQEDSFQSLLQNLSTQVNPNLSSIIHGDLNSRDINQDLEHYLINNFSGTPPVHHCRTQPTSQADTCHYRR